MKAEQRLLRSSAFLSRASTTRTFSTTTSQSRAFALVSQQQLLLLVSQRQRSFFSSSSFFDTTARSLTTTNTPTTTPNVAMSMYNVKGEGEGGSGEEANLSSEHIMNEHDNDDYNGNDDEDPSSPIRTETSSEFLSVPIAAVPLVPTELEPRVLKKFHHFTVCMVPPDEAGNTSSTAAGTATVAADNAWALLTRARTELKDPGLYRWPPHVNLLYPFPDVYALDVLDADVSDDVTDDDDYENVYGDGTAVGQRPRQKLNADIMERLVAACRQCPPFHLRLERFGTFGGSHRGVLWVYPDSSYTSSEITGTPTDGIADQNANASTEPLMELQRLLQDAFPDCDDQSKAGGESIYRPHMTLSHFLNLEQAEAAKQQVESWWPSAANVASAASSSNDNDNSMTNDPNSLSTAIEASRVEFWVPEIYLLYRDGPDSQFYRVADLGLGQTGKLTTHDPPVPFVHMPTEEASWVRQERLAMQTRRRKSQGGRGRGGGRGGRGGRGGGGRGRSQQVPDSPEVIAAKRAARADKRLAMEAAAAAALDMSEDS
jgi:hypothetical protein